MHSTDRGVHRSSWSRLALLAAVLAIALAPATAAGQQVEPTEAQYGTTLEQISQGGGGADKADVPPGGGAETARAGGGLPFTGLDIAALAIVAVALAGAGIALRRLRASEDIAG